VRVEAAADSSVGVDKHNDSSFVINRPNLALPNQWVADTKGNSITSSTNWCQAYQYDLSEIGLGQLAGTRFSQ
jgi:hypothetical protein